MSPGKAAYEQRKQEKIERKSKMEKTEAERRAREDRADAVVDLVMVALTGFLRGDAAFIVTDGPDGSKLVAFGSIASNATPKT